MKILAASFALILAAACSQETPPDPAASVAPAPAAPAVPAAPPKTEQGFDVQLTLTPRAAEKLAAMGEMVTVDAYYFGDPKPGGLGPQDEHEEIALGHQQENVAPANALVVITGKGFDPARLGDTEGAPQVLVNVFTARKAHTDNLIGCDIYQGPVSMVRTTPAAIKCDLLEPPADPG